MEPILFYIKAQLQYLDQPNMEAQTLGFGSINQSLHISLKKIKPMLLLLLFC